MTLSTERGALQLFMNSAAALLMGVVFVGAEGAPALAAQECGAIANLKIENTNLLSATEVPAAGDLPAYCRVLGRPSWRFP